MTYLLSFKNKLLKILKNADNRGFSLVEILISLMIISLITLVVYSIIILSLRVTSDNSSYVEAISLADQKMERIRNMPYSSVGTLMGNPHGLILDNETINKSAVFNVKTLITYTDDPYDGTLLLGTDSIFDDYKIAIIDIEWEGRFGPRKVTVSSKIIPATEETDSGNGLLKISVVNANGLPVQGANINIKNDLLSPSININVLSSPTGEYAYSAPPSFEGYEVTVTKAGYGTDKTYERDAINLNPTKPFLSVVDGIKTEQSFQIDFLASLSVKTITQDLPSSWIGGENTSDDQTNSRIAIDNAGYIYTVWQDYEQTGKPEIYGQKYDSGGNPQWPNPSSPSDIVVVPTTDSVLPDILTDINGNLFLAWHDDALGDKQVYILKLTSIDGSKAWGGNKVETLDNSANQTNARIALLEKTGTATSTIVWQDDRTDDGDIYIQQFDYTTGSQLWASEIKVNDSSNGTTQFEPCIASDSDDFFYVAWSDNRDTDLNIYAARFNRDGNADWINNLRMDSDSGNSDQYSPEIDSDSDDYFYITWTDERNGDKDIYLQKYSSNGIAVWAEDLLVNSDGGFANQFDSSIKIDTSNNIYIVWTDEREGNQDIYGQKISTDGVKLWSKDIRVNINLWSSNQYNPHVTIDPSTDPDNPYVTWQSDINGDQDIFIASFGEYGASSTVANIDFNLRGTKQIGDNPVIYEHDSDYTTDANGEATITLEWDSPGYTATPSSTIYSLIFSQPSMPVLVLPGQTQELLLYLQN